MVIPEWFLLASFVSTTINILYVAMGLGLVIFFHELGHFAVAKWCNVHVERFSIGFGPILWSWKKGETEYAFSAIPFGGYVKMLGQDDMDPSQLSSEEIAEDPRSYSSKSVKQRMAIISAGVIMNVFTGMLFFAIAFGFGVQTEPATLGTVRVGMPAWEAGLRTGDTLTRINDREIESFMDIMRGVALSRGDVKVEGTHSDGSKFGPIYVTPDGRGTRRVIGVGPSLGTTLITPGEEMDISVTARKTAAARAKPPFQPGDTVKKIDGVEIPNFATMQWILAEKRGNETVVLTVERAADGTTAHITVGRNLFRVLGLLMDIGEIVAIRKGSPADRAGLQKGDKITHVGKLPIGGSLNPLRLPDVFEEFCRKRETVVLKVLRKSAGKDPKAVSIQFRDSDPVIPAWIEKPFAEGEPLSIPALGVAFHMIPTIAAVKPGSEADKKGVKPNERIEKMELILPDGEQDGRNENKTIVIEFGTKHEKTGRELKNWAYAFWTMQMVPTRTVTLHVADEKGKVREVALTPTEEPGWYQPTRGFRPDVTLIELKAYGVLDALKMGTRRTRDTISDTYLILMSLFGGRLSPTELSGPVGIAKIAYKVAERGMPELLLFLGFLSMNLAVLNFLPIPVLDGGHMVFLIWEGVTRKKPSERVMVAATYVGIAFVLALLCFVMYLDLFVH